VGVSGLGRELMRSLAGITPRLVADREWRLGPLVVAIDGAKAQLRYAREPVGTSAASAEAIAGAWKRAKTRLEARSLAPDALLPKLADAYRGVVAAAGKRAGDRVPLVEVRAAIGGTRAQFAWDLARLRRERRLALPDGRRIDLGIATGHAATQRSRVVWIEDESGGGAFYETIRLLEVRS
jgi:hypothetical protein